MTTQERMAAAIQGDYAWEDSQVWCVRCGEHVRPLEYADRRKYPDELCESCEAHDSQEAEIAAEEAEEAA